MKRWQPVVLSVVLLVAGCGSDDQLDDDRLGGVAQPDTEAKEASAEEANALAQPVEFDVSVHLDETSRLVIEVATNLPEGTRLRIMADRSASGVSWRDSQEVADGAVSAGPFGPGSGLPEGDYRIRVVMPPASVQPAAVRSRLGDKGQHLTGEWVVESEHGLGQIVEAAWQVRIEPSGVKFLP
ncbi:hypothetical protein OM427_06525 [Halomonas sp. 18H]|uniref:hypothetical protein n=1 Tax=Halomonas almeriensis TaxID=308163 RepID=UPI0022317CAB|nr:MULTISPECIES: hypothetical protein [Halomonas]MCW4149186.1 hypothetical protein [Halomonas sp. 18H]MDN3552264.1 hypothetical protein [Halomonas almeriensis]